MKRSHGDHRNCEQCGAIFMPRREDARFCCVRCRAAWNRAHMGDLLAEGSGLLWSVTAMSEATARLPQAEIGDRARAYGLIGEAVWWIALVDATLIRHQPEVYDAAVADQLAAQRPPIGGTLAGLRFVRNQVVDQANLIQFVQAGASRPGAGDGRITDWRWKPVPRPVLATHPPRAQVWEMTRYQAYQAHLAGRTIGEVFHPAAAFLTLTAVKAGSLADLAYANASTGPI